MKYSLFFTIHNLPKTPNETLQKHWRVNSGESKKWKRLVWHEILSKGAPLKPLAKAKLTLTRCSSVSPDYDGLVGSFKHVMDGLVESRVIESDKMDCIGKPDYRWEKTAPKKGRIEILIESL